MSTYTPYNHTLSRPNLRRLPSKFPSVGSIRLIPIFSNNSLFPLGNRFIAKPTAYRISPRAPGANAIHSLTKPATSLARATTNATSTKNFNSVAPRL